MADEVTTIPTDSSSGAAAAPSAAPDYSGFAERMNSSLSAEPTPAPQEPTPAPQTPAADTTTPSPETPKPTEPTPAPAFNESEYLAGQFGDKYKTPAEVKAELEAAETLRQNQLTDEHRRSLALLSDPAVATEYLRLSTTDYAKMDPLTAMRENFARKNPQFDAEELPARFERFLENEYPGAAGIDPEHPDFEDSPRYRSDKLLMDKQAERDRAELTAHRDQRTAELMAGVKVGAAPDAEPKTPAEPSAEDKAILDAHIAKVGELVKDPLDITVELPDGQKVSIKARETPEEIQAAEQVMRDPFGDYTKFLYPDGKTLDYDALQLWTAFRTQGRALFANAVAVGRDLTPPHVTLDGLTNGGTPAAQPAPITNDPAGFAARFADAMK